MQGIQTEIIETALNTFMGSEKNWCAGAYAKDKDGMGAGVGSKQAVQHCAEGAITAAASRVLAKVPWGNWRSRGEVSYKVMAGVEKILVEQHPDFVAEVQGFYPAACKGDGRSLPTFNDGADPYRDRLERIQGVGYQGIRDAFEKYLVECQEKGL